MENDVEHNFFDIGGYRQNVKRYKDGIDQLAKIQAMLQERIYVEDSYVKALKGFHARWDENIQKNTSGAVKEAWRKVMEESLEISRLHTNVRDRITDEVVKTIGIYLKDNYHLSAFRSAKELRDIEEQFEKAQRPWRKQYEKMEKAKKSFNIAAQKERSSFLQKRNAEGDSSISADNARKYDSKWQKCKVEAEGTELVYKKTLSDLDAIKDDYVSHMKDVFAACQQKELKRLKFVFEMLSGLQKALSDLSNSSRLQQLHHQIREGFTKKDESFTADLNQWSEKYGPDSPFNWPKFEPFTPSLHSITTSKTNGIEGEVVLVGKTDRKECDGTSLSSVSDDLRKNLVSNVTKRKSLGEAGPSLGTRDDVDDKEQVLPDAAADNDGFETVLYKAIALYDYKAQDGDELSISKGDVIEILRESDSLNWSIGRKNGKEGFLPATYVEKMQ
uniref:F-BAR domain-containing protein n=1 Tax=Syphacia muris TaxID=451379 RepID=A0A0N5A959_9BILA